MHPLFVKPLYVPRTHSTVSVIHSRGKRRLVSSVLPSTNEERLSNPPVLAQTARVVMASIQLSTFVSPSLVAPLYSPDIRATISSSFPVIQALGFANISTAITLHAHRSLTRPCRLGNTAVFAATALLHLVSHIKPGLINIPFAATLAAIAVLNNVSVPEASRSESPPKWRLAPLAKLGAAVSAFCAGIFAADVVSRVYLLQVFFSLGIASFVAAKGQWVSPFLGFADALMLAGMAARLVSQGIVTVAIFAVAAIFEGWDAVSQGGIHFYR